MSKETFTTLAVEFQETKTHSSFSRLYHRLRPGLKSYVRNFVKDGDVTEDILARTFEKIYRKIDTYKPEYSITTWAYTIARRECLRWIKRERNKKVSLSYFNENGGEVVESDGDASLSFESNITSTDGVGSTSEAWGEDNYQMEKYGLTVKAINDLKPMYRDILVDVLFSNMKYKEVAYKIEPELDKMHEELKADNLFDDSKDAKFSEADKKRLKVFNKYYKKILQRVKNRVRRGKMLVENVVNDEMKKMDI